MSFLDWLSAICLDGDPAKPGFQPQLAYLVACVVGPVLFGAFVAMTLAGIERVFGIKLSSKGGH